LPALTIELQDPGPPPTFLLGGSLDAASRIRIPEVLLPGLQGGGWDGLVLDLTWLTYLDRQGLQSLIELAEAATGDLVLRSAQGLPLHVLGSIEPRFVPRNLRIEVPEAIPVAIPGRELVRSSGTRIARRRATPAVHGASRAPRADGSPRRRARSA